MLTKGFFVLLSSMSLCAYASDLPGEHVMPSDQFKELEKDKRQHTFIQLGAEGKFGYHVSLFLTNHQHQLIVSSNLTIKNKNPKQLRELLTKPASNGYYTVLTDKPQFPLGDILEGRKKVIPVDFYDGIIGIDAAKKLLPEATYEIKNIIFTTPMHVEDKMLESSNYIVFGNNGGEQTKYFMAHLIWGAGSFDQVLEVESTVPVKIENGILMSIDKQKSADALTEGQSYVGRVNNQNPVDFKVTKQVHFRSL